jgi:hypothetical protein
MQPIVINTANNSSGQDSTEQVLLRHLLVGREYRKIDSLQRYTTREGLIANIRNARWQLHFWQASAVTKEVIKKLMQSLSGLNLLRETHSF